MPKENPILSDPMAKLISQEFDRLDGKGLILSGEVSKTEILSSSIRIQSSIKRQSRANLRHSNNASQTQKETSQKPSLVNLRAMNL